MLKQFNPLAGVQSRTRVAGSRAVLSSGFAVCLILLASLPLKVLAQDHTKEINNAHLALGAIEADSVELSRIADYQSELLKLAREDLLAAATARRSREACASRVAVVRLCDVLTQSFPVNGGGFE